MISLLDLHGFGSHLDLWPRVTSPCVQAGSFGCLLDSGAYVAGFLNAYTAVETISSEHPPDFHGAKHTLPPNPYASQILGDDGRV